MSGPQFLSSFIRRIVLYGDEGDIKLTQKPVLDAVAMAASWASEKQAGDSVFLEGTPDGEPSKGMLTWRTLHFTLARTRRR